MTPRTNRLALTVASMALSVIAVMWSSTALSDAASRLADSEERLEECRELSREAQTFLREPDVADTRTMANTDLLRIAEHAARESGTTPDAIDRVWPLPDRPVKGTEFVKKPTQIVLRGVSLSQALSFARTIADEHPKLSTSELRISADRNLPYDDVWTCELTITHLVYVPDQASTHERGAL